MKKVIAILLILSLLTGCSSKTIESNQSAVTDQAEERVNVDTIEFADLSDTDLLRYVEDNIYNEIIAQIDNDNYFVENIETRYYSKEYLENLSYNSKSNIFFGFTLEDLNTQFNGQKYVFTLGTDGQTTVIPLETYTDTTVNTILKNVAIGTGVILICVTVSAVSATAGLPAVSVIFAASATKATSFALSSTVFGGISAGIVKAYQTGDINYAIKSAAVGASEGFKWGAIIGAVEGGATELIALKGATLNGLTMNEAALIQKESGYPLDVIKEFHNMDEYSVFKNAGLKSEIINGKNALIRTDIDLYNIADEYGRNNLARMSEGLAPLDSSGNPFELHHIGQKSDGTLAILSKAEHDSTFLHGFLNESEINRTEFASVRKAFWKTMAKYLGKV